MVRARCIGLTSLRTEAVLLQSNASPHPVGAPAPGANGRARCIGLTSLRTEAVLLQLNASPPPCRSTRPGCEQTIARPTPRPAVRQTERTAPSLPRPL